MTGPHPPPAVPRQGRPPFRGHAQTRKPLPGPAYVPARPPQHPQYPTRDDFGQHYGRRARGRRTTTSAWPRQPPPRGLPQPGAATSCYSSHPSLLLSAACSAGKVCAVARLSGQQQFCSEVFLQESASHPLEADSKRSYDCRVPFALPAGTRLSTGRPLARRCREGTVPGFLRRPTKPADISLRVVSTTIVRPNPALPTTAKRPTAGPALTPAQAYRSQTACQELGSQNRLGPASRMQQASENTDSRAGQNPAAAS